MTLPATQNSPINWLGGFDPIPATGKPVAIGEYVIWRIEAGKIVERWLSVDNLEWLQQIGITHFKAEFGDNLPA